MSPPSSKSADFPDKVVIPCPQDLSLNFIGLLCDEQYNLGLNNGYI